ncbi:6-phosphofructokinase [Patescibacteria group bacterium]|nr:6-phosphofructokinase [Patescibacteria group bacterium]
MSNPEVPEHTPKRIGLFTGGGTAPGWNAVIHGCVSRLQDTGNEAYGIPDGWAGLLESKSLIDFSTFTRERLVGLMRKGGSILRSSRTKIKPDQHPIVWEMMDEYELDGVVAIGGDDTLTQADEISRSGSNDRGFIGVPKTIDDDPVGTERTFGFQTAVHDAAQQIIRVRTDAKTNNRVAVVEIMGRDCGRVALHAGYYAGADITLVPEFPIDERKLVERIEKIHEEQGFVIVAISEGYAAAEGSKLDEFGHGRMEGAAANLAEVIKARTKPELNTMKQVTGYDVRSGPPIAPDGIFASEMGALAGQLAHEGNFGRMVSLREGRLVGVPLSEVGRGRHLTDLEYNIEGMCKWDLPPNIMHELLGCRSDLNDVLLGKTQPDMPN